MVDPTSVPSFGDLYASLDQMHPSFNPASEGTWSTESTTWTIPEGVRPDWHYDLLSYTRYTLGDWRFVTTVDNVNVGDAVVAKIKEQKPKRTFSNFSDYLKDKGVL